MPGWPRPYRGEGQRPGRAETGELQLHHQAAAWPWSPLLLWGGKKELWGVLGLWGLWRAAWGASQPQEAALQLWGKQGVPVALGLLLMQALSSPCPGLRGGAPGVPLLRPAPGLGVLLPAQDLPALPAPVPAAGRRGHLHGVEPQEAGTRHPRGSARASWGPLALVATACPRGARARILQGRAVQPLSPRRAGPRAAGMLVSQQPHSSQGVYGFAVSPLSWTQISPFKGASGTRSLEFCRLLPRNSLPREKK